MKISFYDSRIKIVRSLSLLLPQQQKGHLHKVCFRTAPCLVLLFILTSKQFLKGSNNPEVEEAQAEVGKAIPSVQSTSLD